jgi:methyltransferase (TIGR00027 family)
LPPPDHGPSQTAAGVAWLRAAHQLLDDPPLILTDPAIVALLGADNVERLCSDPARLQSPGAQALRSHIVLRSRFAEDGLEAAAARGVRQYVILGAGYDTFIVRQPDWARALRITEVDRPETQAAKRARLAAANLTVPDNVTFAGIDFESETLADGLHRHGVALDEPIFFSWLGVTMYLTGPAIDAVLRTVAGCSAGSEIVFTFAPARGESDHSHAGATLAERAASVGEPWRTYFEPAALGKKLNDLGFGTVQFLTPAEAAARYFANRTDGLPVPRRTTIVRAINDVLPPRDDLPAERP